MVTIADSYGRDADWLRARLPKRRPGKLARFISAFWPLQSVEIYDTYLLVQREQDAVDAHLLADWRSRSSPLPSSTPRCTTTSP